jgi:hypothetical protein
MTDGIHPVPAFRRLIEFLQAHRRVAILHMIVSKHGSLHLEKWLPEMGHKSRPGVAGL